MRQILLLFIVACPLIQTFAPANSSITYSFQVGAYGDAGSLNNIGLRAQIRTHTYPMNQADEADTFWIGDTLVNGAFIQFGYAIYQAGIYCVNAEQEAGTQLSCSGYRTVHGSEAFWFWQYWPNATASLYYSGIGAAGSVGANGTWHAYTIEPNSRGEWRFLLDERQVASIHFRSTNSTDEAAFVAEKISESTRPGRLGPVEFRNLTYLKRDGWHSVTDLYAIVGCGVNPNCAPNPYGVSVEGPNHIIAGTSLTQPHYKEVLWDSSAPKEQSKPQDLLPLILTGVTVIAAVTAAGIFAMSSEARKARKKVEHSKRLFSGSQIRRRDPQIQPFN
jgi:hypothetical protein